jgi:hypothetical protein
MNRSGAQSNGQEQPRAENPYAAPSPDPATPTMKSATYETYQLVTDVATGVSFRKSDNFYQAVAIFVSVLLGVPIGWAIGRWSVEGAVLGGAAGLLVGLFGSGIFLMIYRLFRHY